MSFLGIWKLNDYLTWSVTTHVATTGAISNADANPSYRVYEDNVGTPLLTGSLTQLDSANTTGLYHQRVQVTPASGFEKGKSYNILNKGTVNSVSGQITHSFQLDNGFDLSASAVDSILDEIVEGTLTLRQIARLLLSKAVGKASGGGTTTITFRDNADSKDRITMTVNVNGNRSAVTLDGS